VPGDHRGQRDRDQADQPVTDPPPTARIGQVGQQLQQADDLVQATL